MTPQSRVDAALSTFKQIHDRPRPQTLSLSPDGRWLAVVERNPIWREDRYAQSVVIHEAASMKRVARQEFPSVMHPQWSPTGAALFFVAGEMGGDRRSVLRWSMGRSGPAASPRITARSGRNITGLIARSPKQVIIITQVPANGDEVSTIKFPAPPPRSEVRLMPGGRLLGAIEGVASSFTVSDDGRLLAYIVQPTPYADSAFETEVHVLDTATGKSRRVGRPRWYALSCKFSNKGPQLAVVSHNVPGVYPSRMDLFVVDVKTNRIRNISGRHDRCVAAIHGWDEQDRSVYAGVYDGLTLPLRRFDLTGEVTTLCDENVSAAVVCNGELTHWISESGTHLPQVRSIGRKPSTPRFKVHEQRIVRWRAKDGLAIEGILILPSKGKPPYPLLVNPHGGPASPMTNLITRYDQWQPLAAAGYAVLAPSFRSTAGYGEAFVSSTIRGDGKAFLDGPLGDMIAGADMLIRKGIADPGRLGIFGISFGGISTLYALGKTNRFRVGIACAPVTDFVSDAAKTQRGRYAEIYFEGKHWEKPEVYRQFSPLGHLHKIAAPLLLIQGGADVNTHPTNADEAAYVMRHIGRAPFRYVTYPRDGHALDRPKTRIDFLRELTIWTAKYL